LITDDIGFTGVKLNSEVDNYKKKIDTFRILAVDDHSSILELFLQVLSRINTDSNFQSKTLRLNEKLSCKNTSNLPSPLFDIATCQQADEAVDAVKDSLECGRPFSIAFIDVRMPPGPNGVWAAEHIRKLDSNIEIVIMTGYTDISPSVIARRVPPAHKLLYIQKPFQSHEIFQFAFALSMKWHVECELYEVNKEIELRVEEQIHEFKKVSENLDGIIQVEKELRKANDKIVLRYKNKSKMLSDTIKKLEEKEKDLAQHKSDLEKLKKEMIETNRAFSVLARNIDKNKEVFEKKIYDATTVKILPIVKELKNNGSCQRIMADLDVLETNLNSLFSSSKNHYEIINILTDQEMRVAALIKRGLTTQKISNLLYISELTVKTHRKNIRKKLKINNTNINLSSYLKSNMPSDLIRNTQTREKGLSL
jgi:DNA-binding NarL/FixJ family response regulator